MSLTENSEQQQTPADIASKCTVEKFTLADLNKTESPASEQTILAKSIECHDFGYLQKFLVSDSRVEEISKLQKKEKEALAVLLVEFLDQPLRIEAIDVIYAIISEIGNVDGLCKRLIGRSVDLIKLLYLKGKIDYLKYTESADDEPVPEHTVTVE